MYKTKVKNIFHTADNSYKFYLFIYLFFCGGEVFILFYLFIGGFICVFVLLWGGVFIYLFIILWGLGVVIQLFIYLF